MCTSYDKVCKFIDYQDKQVGRTGRSASLNENVILGEGIQDQGDGGREEGGLGDRWLRGL